MNFMKSGLLERTVFLAAFLNALIFSIFVACPAIRDDGWYTLDTFVRKYFNGSLSIADFFSKRVAFDHAMPLQRAIEIVQYKYFSGDYWIMSLIGVCAGGAGAAYLLRVIKASRGDAKVTVTSVLAACAVCCSYLSINSRWIYDWPLVTIEYAIFLAVLTYFVAVWRALVHGRLLILGFTAITLGIIADDTSLIAALASVGGAGLYAWHEHQWRKASRVVAVIVASFVCTNLGYAFFFTASVEVHSTKALIYVWHQLINNGGWWKVFYIPLCSSVIFPETLNKAFGSWGQGVGWIITISLMVAHGYFWYRQLTHKPSLLSQLSAQVMIFFYGLVAGLVYTRVVNFDIDYLAQPRYVLLYQFNLVALFLLAVEVGFDERKVNVARWFRPILAFAAASIILLQFPLSRVSWGSVKYVSSSYQASVRELGRMYEDPSYQPASCSGILAICNLGSEKRRDLLNLLEKNKKNLFSENFRAFHRLYFDTAETASPSFQ